MQFFVAALLVAFAFVQVNSCCLPTCGGQCPAPSCSSPCAAPSCGTPEEKYHFTVTKSHGCHAAPCSAPCSAPASAPSGYYSYAPSPSCGHYGYCKQCGCNGYCNCPASCSC